MSIIISCVIAKGGAGKTTLAFALAMHWGAVGRRVLLIDCDPQGTLINLFAVREKKGSAEAICVDLSRLEARIKREAASDVYGVIIVDTPSTLREIGPAIKAADVVMMPSQPSGADFFAFKRTFNVCLKIGISIVVVPNRVKSRGQHEILQRTFKALSEGKALIAEPIGDRVDHGSYTIGELSIVDIGPSGKGAFEIAKLAQTLEEVVNGQGQGVESRTG
ncbi:MAG: ParA family protein [Gammaproteobacteria bacterium]|uniref:ParA family protein n=1 Tax=Thalassobaculum sp. TaxID=2022740 RepID=UPI0032EC3104